jgi:hypothetical protein
MYLYNLDYYNFPNTFALIVTALPPGKWRAPIFPGARARNVKIRTSRTARKKAAT